MFLKRFLAVLCLLPSLVLAQEAKIAPADVLLLTCEEEPTLNKEYTVTSQGAILVDFLGAVFVKDMTEKQAAESIKGRLLNERILREATVKIKIVSRQNDPILFSGAVKVTGRKDYISGLRLSDIVRTSQPTESADLKRIEVKSRSGGVLIFDFTSFDPATNENNPLLKPGDEIVFRNKKDPGTIVVLGGVGNPGGVTYESGLTIRKAIAKCGGFSSLAVLSRVRLEQQGKPPVYFDLSKQEIDAPVMEGDRIFVETSEQRKYIMVSGAVKSGGFIELKQGMTLSKAVVAAGGVTVAAEEGRVLLTRAGTLQAIKYDLRQIQGGGTSDPVLLAGDKVTVATKKRGNNEAVKSLSYLALLYILLGK